MDFLFFSSIQDLRKYKKRNIVVPLRSMSDLTDEMDFEEETIGNSQIMV
jgi:hypothetical protein